VTSFVGRDAELALLQDLLAGVGAGIGGLLLVVGEQGIGKSSLLRAALEDVSAGCQVLSAAADELERRIPLRLMEQCLGAAEPEPVPESAGTLTSTVGVFAGDAVQADIERMLARVDRLCAVSPMVLVTEDLHWADEASMLVWSRLARAVGQVPLLLVGSYRPGTGREDLDRLHRGILARGGNVVELGLLADAEVVELVGGLVGGRPGQQLTEMMGQAGGNPMYARELADSLVRDGQVAVTSGVAEIVAGSTPVRVPVSLDAAIGKRLAGLAEDEVRVLRWAAVLGAEFSVTDLEVVSGQSVGDLMEMIGTALRAGVLAEAGTRLEFRHGLIRQALYEGLPTAQRAAMHIEAAQALATADAAAGRVAGQLAAAQQVSPNGELASDWAASWLATAAPVLNYRAPQVAAELFRGTLAQLADDDDRREMLQASLATVSLLLMRPEHVEQIAGPLAVTARDHVRAAEMAWLLAYSRMRAGRVAAADAVIEAALAKLGHTPVAARLIALRAMILILLGQYDKSTEASDEALATAAKFGDRLAAGYAHHARSMVAIVHRHLQAALDHTGQALAVLGGDLQASDLRVLVIANRIGLLSEMDRGQEAAAEAREALTLAEQAGTPRIATARQALADLYLTGGQWDDALAELEPAVGLPGPDYLTLLIHGTISLIAAHRDDGQTAEDHLRRIPDELLSSPAAPGNLHFVQLARATVAEQAGRPDEAIEVLAAALNPAAMPGGRSLLLLPLARLTLAAGDTATAASAAALAREEAEREPLSVRVVIANQCTGLVVGDAAAVLAAAKYYEATGRVPDQAAALEDTAALMARQGDAVAARRALASSLELYEELGAMWDVRRASARLRQHGIRRTRAVSARQPQTGWAALTPTETKVASLVAEGRSNPDIAAQLFLSRNTVQTHVSHILAKLGAQSRAEIIRVAMEHS
jgi:DNA-binding CsgD family transcriptional regulator